MPRMKPGGFTGAIVAVALAGALAGCSSLSLESLNPWSGPIERTNLVPADATVYACDGGKRLIVRYLPDERAVMIIFPDREFRLDKTPSSAGARYTNGATVLQSAHDRVSLSENDGPSYSNCHKPKPHN